MTDTNPTDIERIAREAARAEARDILGESVEADGKEWSIKRLMDRFEISRRNAMIAFGLLAAGSVVNPVEAVLRAVSQPAAAQTQDLTVPGTVDASAVRTEQGDITGESYVQANLANSITGIASGAWQNIVDEEITDNLNEFNESGNARFVPDSGGRVEVTAQAQIINAADGDRIQFRVYDIDAGTDVSTFIPQARTSGSTDEIERTIFADVTAGNAHEVQVNNANSSFDLGPNDSFFTLKHEPVHP